MINIISKKRGISSIIGTLMMVAVVAVIGSVILFQALNGINDFNYYLSFLTGSKNSVNESAVIEHVRFDPALTPPDNRAMDIWIRNTGTSQLEITKVSIVDLNSQVEIIATTNRATIPINQVVKISQSPTSPAGIVWNSLTYCGTATPPPCTVSYKISITTSLGNSFETIATPFNT